MTDQGWSQRMDLKAIEMRQDPAGFFRRAREDARRESSQWLARSMLPSWMARRLRLLR